MGPNPVGERGAPLGDRTEDRFPAVQGSPNGLFEFLREELGEMRKGLFEMELEYEDLLSEMKISRSVYNKCRQTWQL